MNYNQMIPKQLYKVTGTSGLTYIIIFREIANDGIYADEAYSYWRQSMLVHPLSQIMGLLKIESISLATKEEAGLLKKSLGYNNPDVNNYIKQLSMESRPFMLSLEKAVEFFISEDQTKKDIALSVFTEEEITKAIPLTLHDSLSEYMRLKIPEASIIGKNNKLHLVQPLDYKIKSAKGLKAYQIAYNLWESSIYVANVHRNSYEIDTLWQIVLNKDLSSQDYVLQIRAYDERPRNMLKFSFFSEEDARDFLRRHRELLNLAMPHL